MGEGLFQPAHLILILAIALLLFGPKKLPDLGRALGESIRGFKEGIKGGEEKHEDSATIETEIVKKDTDSVRPRNQN